MNKRKQVGLAVSAALMGTETGVAQPTRARTYSFASSVAEMSADDHPVARVVDLDATGTLAEHMTEMSEAKEKLRNSVSSAVSQAKRQNPDATYSIEMQHMLTNRGISIIAMVRRTA